MKIGGKIFVSFEEIKKRASGQSSVGEAQAAYAAILILQICAFYHHTSISKDIFRSAAEEAMKQDVNSERFKKLPRQLPYWIILYLPWGMMANGMNLSLDKGLVFFSLSH